MSDEQDINIRIYMNEDGTVDQIVPSNYYGQFNLDFIRPVTVDQNGYYVESKATTICTCEYGPDPAHTHEWHGVRIISFKDANEEG